MGFRILLLGCLLLASCAPEPRTIVHKTGSTAQEREDALPACNVEGIQEVPRAMTTEYTPGYYQPGTTYCRPAGHHGVACATVGAVNIPPSSRTYDANEGLRNRVVEACMRRKGFQMLVRPTCVTEQDRQRFLASQQGPQPPEWEIPCVL